MNTFLAHLTQRIMWGIVITWHQSSLPRKLLHFDILWNHWAKWNQTS